jgi:nitroreductase
MDIYEAFEKRRTVRGFSRPATEEVVRKIILAGSKALSPDNRQPWEFIIIDDPELIEKIAEHKFQQNKKVYLLGVAQVQKRAYKNCAVVAACYKDGPGNHWCTWMAVQNMALAATAEGLGIVPSTLWQEDQAAVEKLLGLPEGYKLATMVLIGRQKGYPDKFPAVIRRPDFNWLHRNKFGTAP